MSKAAKSTTPETKKPGPEAKKAKTDAPKDANKAKPDPKDQKEQETKIPEEKEAFVFEGGPRRDALVAIETRVQKEWEDAKAYENDPPADGKQEKFFATFPYPYMNGKLHLGHAFTLSKAEFAARYQRLHGKKVLFPFGFHCTGMPIAACADKLKREVLAYGNPPIFPESAKKDKKVKEEKAKVIVKKKKEQKKKSGQATQWAIMREMSVPEQDIIKFQDATHWLYYFPAIAVTDLKRFGLSSDFRRSFITTEINPYYDSFIRWQFRHLKAAAHVLFGSRNTIYSPLEHQPCADHDRSEGEGKNPQEYTLIKAALCRPFPACLNFVKDRKVFLPAATLRPETMYGQTNLFLLPEGDYGVFEMKNGDVFVCSDRSALNMSYQYMSASFGQPTKLGSVRGQDLMGCAVKAPLCQYEKVYILPLLTIKMNKGTGVVTSVPSDAPDDYAALMDLRKDEELRSAHGITEDMVMPFDPMPIIDTPGLGELPAVDLCVARGVESQHDAEKLEAIKAEVYSIGFHQGVMTAGEYRGMKVSEAKPLIKKIMIDAGEAAAYAEPEGLVMSRSGVECVVALTDQWYLNYGEEKWKGQVQQHLDTTLQTYSPHTHKRFQEVVEWLREWACSRSYGLGTKLPWDTQFVIESLSDSTIYMAYYTVAYHLQGWDMNGTTTGPAKITPDQLNDDVWNYIFLNKAYPQYPANCKIPQAVLDKLRKEFEYWYPMDLRVSGKDLIGNHLTMSLYNHAAIWPRQPEMWPRSFFCNGHLLINGDKMSKSTGNFMTLDDAVQTFSADATRLALADAGDGLMDANFAGETANACILRLTKEEDWFTDIINNPQQLRDGPANDFMDKIFENDINACINDCKSGYDSMQFHLALKSGFFNMFNARDLYRANCALPLHRGLIQRYMHTALILLSPICPHWTQHMWKLMKMPGFVMDARFPSAAPEDKLLSRQATYLREVSNNFRSVLTKQKTSRAKTLTKAGKDEKIAMKEAGAYFDKVDVFVATSYPTWQAEALKILGNVLASKGSLPESRALAEILKPHFAPKVLSNAMSFAVTVATDVAQRGAAALELSMPFDEAAFLREHVSFLTRDTGVKIINVVLQPEEMANAKDGATPGKPRNMFSSSSP